ncbi:hypothetical protein MD484_g2167, partial [Candolleomyces efflorescens]
MPLSRLPLPSFSLVLTGANGHPLLAMQDFNSGATNVEVSVQLPQLNAIMDAPTLLQPNDNDPLMQTLDTRFQGQLSYSARYATDARKSNDEDDGETWSETGTIFEPSAVGPVYELQPLGETRRARRHPARGTSPGLLRRLNMKFSAFWRRLRCLGALVLCRHV